MCYAYNNQSSNEKSPHNIQYWYHYNAEIHTHTHTQKGSILFVSAYVSIFVGFWHKKKKEKKSDKCWRGFEKYCEEKEYRESWGVNVGMKWNER